MQNHTGTDDVLIINTLNVALVIQNYLGELLIQHFLQVEADMADSLGLKTIPLRFLKYVRRQQALDGVEGLWRKISEN